jgi:GNAT superfamily N-acetyltransferase
MTTVSQTDRSRLQAAVIRRACEGDAATLAALGRATFTQTFGHLYPPQDLARFLDLAHAPEQARSDLADPAKGVWLAEVEGKAVGYALVGPCDLPHPEVRPGDGELKRLYLLAGRQSGGIGAGLLDAALAWLQRDGPRPVWLGVWSENHGAQRFYERRGFAPVGEYGFRVGDTVDRELILRRPAESFSKPG